MKGLKVITRILKRHNIGFLRSIVYELFIRLYTISFIRVVLKRFFSFSKPERMVFVLGCYNAGTTVVKNAIGLHPEVTMAPVEGDSLTSQLPSHEDGGWPRCMMANYSSVIAERSENEICSEKLLSDWRPWVTSGKVYLEKSISNTVRIPLLRKAFPGCQFVCVTRSPEGVVKGIKKRSSPGSEAQVVLGSKVYPDNLLLRQWSQFYEFVLDDYSHNSSDIHFCSYEKFIDNSVTEFESLIDFLNLKSVQLSFEDNTLIVEGESLAIHPRSNDDNNDYLDSAVVLQRKIEDNNEVLGEGYGC